MVSLGYLNRATIHGLADDLSNNYAASQLSQPEYKGISKEEYKDLYTKFFWEQHNKLIRKSKPELKQMMLDSQKKPQESEEKLEKERLESLVKNFEKKSSQLDLL